MDLAPLTNEELEQLRVDVVNEQERRSALATIPATVAQLATKYVDGGGDRQDIVDAIPGQ